MALVTASFRDMLLKMLAMGVRRYFRHLRNIFDSIITLAALVAVLPSLLLENKALDDTQGNVRFVELFVAARGLRLFRLLQLSEDADLVFKGFMNMLPAVAIALRFLFCFVFVAAAVGCAIFHGVINYDSASEKPLAATDYARLGYFNLNFNDMLSAAVLVFTLLIANNWLIIATGFEIAAPTPVFFTRLYFLLVYAVGVLLFVNVVVAYVIDSLLRELKKYLAAKEANSEETKDAAS